MQMQSIAIVEFIFNDFYRFLKRIMYGNDLAVRDSYFRDLGCPATRWTGPTLFLNSL